MANLVVQFCRLMQLGQEYSSMYKMCFFICHQNNISQFIALLKNGIIPGFDIVTLNSLSRIISVHIRLVCKLGQFNQMCIHFKSHIHSKFCSPILQADEIRTRMYKMCLFSLLSKHYFTVHCAT
jgi:hypothetical protein